MREVRRILRKALEEGPVSMRKLAEEAGISHAALSQFLSGKSGLRPETVGALAGALRTWSARYGELAESLDAALTAETGGGDE